MSSVSVEKIVFVFLLLGYFHRNGVSSFSLDELRYMANNLEIHYEVVDNLENSDAYRSRMALTNKGKKQIKRGPWAIYFNFIRLIEPKHLMNNPSGYVLQKAGVKFSHIAGSLFKLEPVKGFKTLSGGKSLEFDFEAQYFSVARTDIMPNWYIAAEGLEAMNIVSTTGEGLKFVGKFDTMEKWKRARNDLYNPFTPEQRLQRIKVEESKPNQASIIPTPVELNVAEGVQYVNISDWVIVSSTEFETEASYLRKKLKLSIKNDTGGSHTKVFRLLKENVDVNVEDKSSTSSERYKVEVNARENIITISAPEANGIFYGIQSLLAVTNVERKQVLVISLKDAPRFEYRGLMLDISRNFHGKTTIIKILDVMGKYKLNKLHLHLTDDEGWRLEIPGLEELTKFGGKRCHNTTMCLAPQIGSGATPEASGSGYLTVQDYKEILQHAKTLHIEIIPEFDMPGHSHAAIKAMEYRFLKYNSSANETVRKDASKFLLTELGDPSSYFSVQMFRHNAVNPCLNSTYNFIERVVSTLVNIHKDISPLKVFHMGGDEVAKGAWINSTACKNLMTVNKDIDSLKKYFTKRFSEIIQKYSINFAAWEDGLIENENIFNKSQLFSNGDVFSYAWDNVWEWGKFNRAYRLANAGYKTVLAHATHLYFDMPYEPDPEERGYYWATRFTDTKKTFGYIPDNVYENAKEERFGRRINKTELCKTRDICSPLVKQSGIVGIQGHLWSETVRTEDQLFYMCFPRVLALAERAWHKAKFENENGEKSREEKLNMEWQKFANLLGYDELRNLDEMGVNYRVPLPGAKMESGRLVASSAFPGLKIEYKTDGGKEWKEYTLADSKLSGKVRLRTKSADGRRYSREIEMNIPISHHSQGTRSKNPAAIVQLVMFISIFLHST